jgi:hypothetical protein
MADGGYSLSCKGSLRECLHNAERICRDQGYTVREARDTRERLGGETGQSQVVIEKSDAIIYCGDTAPHAEPRLQRETEPGSSTTQTAAPAVPRVCVPGATQACIGPAGCSGGQACSPDGSRFGDCNCGAPQAAPAASP